jgi:uncharacterized protein YbjT (DUF2867 family)
MTRKPDAAGFPPQIEVMRGDLIIPDTLDGCLHGIDTVFLVRTAPPAAVVPALDRIARHARRIVFLSAPIKTPHPLFQQPNPHRLMVEQIEQLIETSGVEWTFLRPGMLAANALGWWAQQIRAGDVVRWPYADVPTAPIHERDIAAVAVRTLCESGHAGAEYVLTGPQSLTHAEQVSTIGRAIGRSLRIEEVAPGEWRQELLPIWPATLLDMLLDAWSAAAGHAAFVTSVVARITGAPAHTFADWATDYASEFRKGGQG